MPRYTNRGTRYTTSNPNQNVRGGMSDKLRNYVSQQSGARRHQVVGQLHSGALPLGDYVSAVQLKFKRSFDAGNPDVAPTATASNNYQSSSVFNGSQIRNAKWNYKINSQSSGDGIYLDVYTLTYSFGESLYQDAVYKTLCPVEFGETLNIEGEVTFKSPDITWTENNFKNYKGLQRHIKKIGTIFVSSEDGGTPSAEFNIVGAPAKCVRSQTGMFYGILFHYSADKNTQATGSFEIIQEFSFDEVPSDNRVPFVW